MTPRTACTLALLAAAASAWAQTAPPGSAIAPAPASSAPEVAPKLSPLLGLVLGRVLDAAVEAATGDTSLGLFRRLAKGLRGDAAEAPSTAAPAADSQALSREIAPPSGRAPASTGAAQPMLPTLAYAMELLDPATFAVLQPVPVAGNGALLRTGDVFALQFSTNLPGQVRLENTDPAGVVSDLGTYTVLVDQLNRLPRDRGIQLQGRPGLEKLRFYFYPCMPMEASGQPWVDDFRGKLPPCGRASPVQTASAGDYGAVAPRALVNLAQPDATMVFASSTDYQAGDVTLMEATLRHEPSRPPEGRIPQGAARSHPSEPPVRGR